jgi:uncharacterized protein (TIGR03492 family)
MKLLCLSNGHGEDSIGARILDQLHQQDSTCELAALPMVGLGQAYLRRQIPLLLPGQVMPSGGFLYMNFFNLWQDLQQGVLSLTWQQSQIVRNWAAQGGEVLAVGDIVPLLIAWRSGAKYSFVGTAKSDYYNRPGSGNRSNYFPWEQWLMQRTRCQAVFPRDAISTASLRQRGIPAFDLGNPMMDGLTTHFPTGWDVNHHPLTILLLPGSRAPEAHRNWQILLTALAGLIHLQPKVIAVAALPPGLESQPFQVALLEGSWLKEAPTLSLADPHALEFRNGDSTLILTQAAYNQCLHMADVAIAMAGTATEEFVGLGKPAFIIPGQGPQFTPRFALRQTQLLGISVTLVEEPEAVGAKILTLLANPDQLSQIRRNGQERLGSPGASARIAAHLLSN